MQLDLASLDAAYRAGQLTPRVLIERLLGKIKAEGIAPVWLALLEGKALEDRLARLEQRRAAGDDLPLYGAPFAVKDNIDVAGLPTSAGCPAFRFEPTESAFVVQQLEAAGAIPLGKTNLDQFATGLVGTRSPFGAPSSVFNPDYISGGSSSGSAVAVASGLVSFSLGSDTAGSGRVPAAFNALVGLKPTRGLLSGRGLLPACRSLDCISIFAKTVADARAVLAVAGYYDPSDAFSRAAPTNVPSFPRHFRFGVPQGALEFCGDTAYEALFGEAIRQAEAIGGVAVPFDFAPFAETAALLYQGPFVAERLAALQQAKFTDWEQMDPVVAAIIKGAEKYSAADAFRAQYRLAELARLTQAFWDRFDLMLLPTTPTIFTHREIAEDPIGRNAKLGTYTNFVNLLDLAALAIPAGFRPDGMPFGISLIGPAFHDLALAELGADFVAGQAAKKVTIAVVGAHLSGQPLNHQLLERKARLVRSARSAAGYRLYALAGTSPAKPGLMRDPSGAGGIELELWEMDEASFGSFTALVPPPLGIGNVVLEDGSLVKGFICEAAGLPDAEDITLFGGWRAYLAARQR